ncbi:type II toxin-antitoxin system RelE/ParE family toxin [Epilithonimonas vandammei]|uniref:Type II toxin-antitoxin system RelE/ParE family toxin n=1 Tax=Epilithonimonas vandammei TaxID=2487072 RepID=A0A3G8ZS02_9FLAO|nr:type II toxin-antitoxin system RelE/ParE family toxin [Epilithonimonas vandammei]AZI56581.1 type II toxin-antitoxin system RelE/ParE family toxin [Epilithonimonas vandammei]
MAFKVIVSPIAKSNVREAASYYKKEVSDKVARKFIEDYAQTIVRIKQNPYFQIYYKDFRGLTMRKFPYIIFYQVSDDIIFVKAVFNALQDTKKRPK